MSTTDDYKNDAEYGSTRHYNSVVEGLEMFKNDPLLFEPGTKYNYTTHGFGKIRTTAYPVPNPEQVVVTLTVKRCPVFHVYAVCTIV